MGWIQRRVARRVVIVWVLVLEQELKLRLSESSVGAEDGEVRKGSEVEENKRREAS